MNKTTELTHSFFTLHEEASCSDVPRKICFKRRRDNSRKSASKAVANPSWYAAASSHDAHQQPSARMLAENELVEE